MPSPPEWTNVHTTDEMWSEVYPEVEHLWAVLRAWSEKPNVKAAWIDGYHFCLVAQTNGMSTGTAAYIIEQWSDQRGFIPSAKNAYTGENVEFTRGHFTIRVERGAWSVKVTVIYDGLG